MDYKKPLIAVILSGIVYIIVNVVSQIVVPVDWTGVGGMRAFTDPLMMAMFLYGFVAAVGAVVLYTHLTIKGDLLHKAARFGGMMWLATSVPSAFIIYTTMIYPPAFFFNTLVFGLISWVLIGYAIVWALSEKKIVKNKK